MADMESNAVKRGRILDDLRETAPEVAAAIEGGDLSAPFQAYADFRLGVIIDEIAGHLATLDELRRRVTEAAPGKDRTCSASGAQ